MQRKKIRMKFCQDKCKALPLGRNNQFNKHKLGPNSLGSVEEKVLGVTVDHKLNTSLRQTAV